MTSTTKTPYGEELVDKSLAFVQTAQYVAIDLVSKGVESLRQLAPQAHDALATVDLVDARHAVDSAFEVADRVLASQRAFVRQVLDTLFEAPGEPAA